MTKRKKIELLEFRLNQLEEENQLLRESSDEGVKKQIELFENTRKEYEELIDKFNKELEQIQKLKYSINQKEIVKMMKKIDKKISKI